MKNFYDFKVKGIDGRADLLAGLEGKVVLAVNVASQCGLTPQYVDL
jgi:glutathione peroxidase